MKRCINLLLLYFVGATSILAQHEILDEFNAKQSNEQVIVRLVISGGRSCDGIEIYRGVDSTNVSLIGKIPGICGGSDNPVPYEFTDENPVKNKKVYYRANLGQQGFTTAIPFTFLAYNNNVLLYPSPAESYFNLNINLDNYEAQVTVYNASGNKILAFSTNSNQNIIDVSDWPTGNYLTTITLKGTKTTIPFIKK